MIGQGKNDNLSMLAIFYDPCKSVLQMVKMLKNACKSVANLTSVLRMKRELDTWVTNLHYTHCGCFSLSYICRPLSNQLIFFQICTHCPHTEMPIRMLENLYGRLTTTTNALPTIRMACEWLQICCEWLQI